MGQQPQCHCAGLVIGGKLIRGSLTSCDSIFSATKRTCCEVYPGPKSGSSRPANCPIYVPLLVPPLGAAAADKARQLTGRVTRGKSLRSVTIPGGATSRVSRIHYLTATLRLQTSARMPRPSRVRLDGSGTGIWESTISSTMKSIPTNAAAPPLTKPIRPRFAAVP
jgi:hypothetical protein